MRFGREKREILGWWALLAPLPLPLNDVLGWGSVGAYSLAVIFFLWRARRGGAEVRWLPNWAMNVLGAIYVPIFLFDLRVLGGGRIVGPVLRLGLFALVVKLFALGRERDKWQAAIGVFFIFIAAMGTSVHPSVVFYLAAFLALGLALLARFAWYHVLEGFGREEATLARVPLARFLVAATIAAIVVSVPLFAILPRVRSPYIVGRGAPMGTELEAAGFSDDVTLDGIGRIRNSRGVALRLAWSGAPPRTLPEELRFKAATYDQFRGASWRRSPTAGRVSRGAGVRYRLSDVPPRRWARIWLQPTRSRSLPVPTDAVALEIGALALYLDQGGAVELPLPSLELLEYRVGLSDRPILLGKPPDESPAVLDRQAITPRIAELAARVAQNGSTASRAARIERHLSRSYSYLPSGLGALGGANPVERFLFESRGGHCELFASAMVLMLRSQGIPARLATGYLGGEFNPFEGYLIVRDSNAHAWVEAWLPEEGVWRTFDPTPPAGRPTATREGFLGVARQAYDYFLFRWDRYVLTFGTADQLEIFRRLHGLWTSVRDLFSRKSDAAGTDGGADKPLTLPSAASTPTDEPLRLGWQLVVAGLGVVLALLAALGYFLRRRPSTPAEAYRRLRSRLARAGAKVPDSLPPLAVRDLVAERFPEAAAPSAQVVGFYLRQTFAEQDLSAAEHAALAEALLEAEERLRPAS